MRIFLYIHLFSHLLLDPPSLSFPLDYFVFCFVSSIKFNLCCQYSHRYMTFHWRRVNLQWQDLNKIDSSFSSSYQLLIVPHLEMRIQAPPCWQLVWFELTWVCACCYNHCEFIYLAFLICQHDTIPCTHPLPLDLAVIPSPSFLRILRSLRGWQGVQDRCYIQTEHPENSCFLHCA